MLNDQPADLEVGVDLQGIDAGEKGAKRVSGFVYFIFGFPGNSVLKSKI